jgi:hypothetical protein
MYDFRIDSNGVRSIPKFHPNPFNFFLSSLNTSTCKSDIFFYVLQDYVNLEQSITVSCA